MRLLSPKLASQPPATELVRFWKRRLNESRRRHKAATAEFHRILEEQQDQATATAYELQEILKARFDESGALSDYLEALRIYSALIKGLSPGRAIDWFQPQVARPLE